MDNNRIGQEYGWDRDGRKRMMMIAEVINMDINTKVKNLAKIIKN